MRVALGIAGLVAVVVAVVLATGVLGADEAAATGDPHAGVGTVDADKAARVLQAAESASTAQSRAALVAEGRRLFRSTEMAKAGEACQSCHIDGGGTNAEVGIIVHPQQAGDFRGPRDVPSLWGVADTPPYGWAGQEETLEEFVVGTIESHFKGGDRQPVAKTAEQVAALVAYLETLEPPASPFDRGTLSPAARRGEELFQGKGGCIDCHAGPLLTDVGLHNTLVPKVEQSDTDPGAARTGALAGAFDTPQMRDVRNTAPYMHNGSLKDLTEVVEFYNERSSVAPLRLTDAEVADLVAYLESL
jgi:cytochrome c peroxidase